MSKNTQFPHRRKDVAKLRKRIRKQRERQIELSQSRSRRKFG